MATVSTTKAPINNTDANFRLWATAVHDAIVTTAGWTDTAATGEINLATATKPGAANTMVGFKVYAMADALQATNPCFLKVEFGAGFSAANNPGIRISVGTAHGGAGNLTGLQVSGPHQVYSSSSSVTPIQCWASGDASRIVIAMFANNDTSGTGILFGVERSKAADGSDNGDAIVLYSVGFSSAGGTFSIRTHAIPPSGGVPPVENRWMCPFSRNLTGSSAFGLDVGMGLLIPFLGPALRPVIGVGVMGPADYPTYALSISVTVYGASHTYMPIGNGGHFNNVAEAGGTNETPTRILMRYE